MKTEQEIHNEIKRSVKNYWDNFRKLDTEENMFHRLMAVVDKLLWVLYDHRFKTICPYCGEIMECDTVDVGIGHQQCGPYHCESCGASEIHSSDNLELDKDEEMTGYYKNRISPIANTCCGHLVDHKEAKRLYEHGLLDNCKPSN